MKNAMKSALGKKIMLMIFIPFLFIFSILSVLISSTVLRYETNWMELEIKGIAEINAADLKGRIDSVIISVLSTADILEKTSAAENSREQAEEAIKSMFINKSIYNVWLTYEPQAFDGMDSQHTEDYPGAPSGRFIRSYIMEDGQIVIAPDMDEETIDDRSESPWYTIPRDTNQLYIDLDNDIANLYDYGVGEDAVYTLSIVSPIRRDGKVIGCVGADVLFDKMTFGIDNSEQAVVAVFYPNGRIFYSPGIEYAEESVDTLGFTQGAAIKEAIAEGKSLFLPDEYSIFIDKQTFTYIQPIHSSEQDESSLSLYVAAPREAALNSLTPIFIIIAASTITVLIALFILFLYVAGKISKPIIELTLAADAISQGNIETEITYFSESKDEIGLLSRSLHRMVEQFRVYITSLEQSQREMTIHSLIEGCIKDSKNIWDTFNELSVMFCRYFGIYKTTIVRMDSGRAIVMSRCEQPEEMPPPECCEGTKAANSDFIGHSQAETALNGKKLVFLNARAIFSQKLTFLDPRTVSVCLLALRKEDLYGYVIFENKDLKKPMNAGTEAILLYIAESLVHILSRKGTEPEPSKSDQLSLPKISEDESEKPRNEKPRNETPAEDSRTVTHLKEIDGLDVEAAITAMDGLSELYEKSVRLTTRLLPDTVEKLDKYMFGKEIKAFAIEVHGLKGVLNNIGAFSLGGFAARLEKAALEDDVKYCRINYEAFKALMVELTDRLIYAVTLENDHCPDTSKVTVEVDKAALSKALKSAKDAAKIFDSIEALNIISGFSKSSYGAETDQLLSEIIFALEAFDCEKALINIEKLEEILNDTERQ